MRFMGVIHGLTEFRALVLVVLNSQILLPEVFG